MSPTCQHCGERFASYFAMSRHYLGDKGCIDIRTDLRWHCDNDGCWTDIPHSRRMYPLEVGYNDEHTIRYND